MYTASPSKARQAPDFNALMKTAILVVEGKPLATEPVAAEYFEPGINKKLTRRTKPKTDYSLPSDMPRLPLGFVPTNRTPGANGEEPAIIKVPELVNADLVDVFAKIRAESLAEQKPQLAMDMGTRTAKAFHGAMTEKRMERKMNGMMERGYTEAETKKAMDLVREEEALKLARMPAAPLTLLEAMKEAFGSATGGDEEPTNP